MSGVHFAFTIFIFQTCRRLSFHRRTREGNFDCGPKRANVEVGKMVDILHRMNHPNESSRFPLFTTYISSLHHWSIITFRCSRYSVAALLIPLCYSSFCYTPLCAATLSSRRWVVILLSRHDGRRLSSCCPRNSSVTPSSSSPTVLSRSLSSSTNVPVLQLHYRPSVTPLPVFADRSTSLSLPSTVTAPVIEMQAVKGG